MQQQMQDALSSVQQNVQTNIQTVTTQMRAIRNNKHVQEQVSRFKSMIENRWFNLVVWILLSIMLAVSIACFFIDLVLHYHLLFICRNALFSFLSVSLFIIIAFCCYHMTRIVLVFRERAKHNPHQGLFRWFTNPANYHIEEDEEDVAVDDEDSESDDVMDHVFASDDVFEPERSRATRILLMILKILFLIVAMITFFSLLLFTVIAVPRQQRTLPQLTGSIFMDFNVKGSSTPTIIREKNGVTHVTADVDYDVFFAQGVAHAQDRLFQLEYNKRVAAGTVSEIAGINTIEVDKLSRIIGFRKAAEKSLSALSQQTRDNIQAYVDGINAYLKTDPNLPPMFGFLDVKPTTWEPVDVLACLKVVGWTLGSNHNREIARFKMLQRGTSKERIDQIMPQYLLNKFPSVLKHEDLGINLTPEEIEAIEANLRDDTGYFQPEIISNTTTDKKPYVPIEGRSFVENELKKAFEELFIDPFAELGSNNWVISGKFTKRGKPLLSDDPHMKLSAPGIWYLNHLHSKLTGLNVIGASFVGVPGVIIGRNQKIAWGITTSYADVQDVYAIEEKESGETYIHNGTVHEYTKREEYIKIVDDDDQTITVLETIYGPVINSLYDVHGDVPLSLRWTALHGGDTTLESYMKLNYAQNHEEFLEAMKSYVIPSQNFVYADDEGNIAYLLAGKVPVRKTGHSGRFVVQGNGKYDYFDSNNIDQYIPFEEMPQVLNPARGFIVSANNRITPPGFKYSVSQDYFKTYRAKRIEELITSKIQANVTMSVSDMKVMQADVKSLMAQDFQFIFERMKGKIPKEEELWRSKLAVWNGIEETSAQEPAVFEAWFREVGRLVLTETGQVWPEPQFLQKALQDEDYSCMEYHGVDCVTYAANALETVVLRFASRYGGVPTWGSTIHEAHFSHQALDGTVYRCMASRSVFNVGGSYTVNVGTIANDDLQSTTGVTYRHIVDLANSYTDDDHDDGERRRRRITEEEEPVVSADADLFIIPLGQSGNFFSPFYENLLPSWKGGEYTPMYMEEYQQSMVLQLQGKNSEEQD
jgi:penicillin amidase